MLRGESLSTNTYQCLFDACVPRKAILEGTLQESQFTSSLATVALSAEEAGPLYQNTGRFFEMASSKDGLRTIHRILTGRFLTESDYGRRPTSSFLCVDTKFGGGKNHNRINTYHLATNPDRIDHFDQHILPEDEDFVDAYREAATNGIEVGNAAFVGGNVDARKARSDRSDLYSPNNRALGGESICYDWLRKQNFDTDSAFNATLETLLQVLPHDYKDQELTRDFANGRTIDVIGLNISPNEFANDDVETIQCEQTDQ